jgi:hypothetical protein
VLAARKAAIVRSYSSTLFVQLDAVERRERRDKPACFLSAETPKNLATKSPRTTRT